MCVGLSLNILSPNAAMAVVFQEVLPDLFHTPAYPYMKEGEFSKAREFYQQAHFARDGRGDRHVWENQSSRWSARYCNPGHRCFHCWALALGQLQEQSDKPPFMSTFWHVWESEKYPIQRCQNFLRHLNKHFDWLRCVAARVWKLYIKPPSILTIPPKNIQKKPHAKFTKHRWA